MIITIIAITHLSLQNSPVKVKKNQTSNSKGTNKIYLENCGGRISTCTRYPHKYQSSKNLLANTRLRKKNQLPDIAGIC